MEYLFQKVLILDRDSKHHNKRMDVLINEEEILDIKKEINTKSKTKIIHHPHAILSQGWIDVGTSIGEPGYDHRETLESISNAAIRGGYTSICNFPNNNPSIHSKSEVEFIINRSKQLDIHIYPIGAVSKDAKGVEMAEILFMAQSGAIAFSDGLHSIQNAGLLMRCLEYIKMVPHALIINTPHEPSLASSGQMHEGITSTFLGLRGIPNLSETVALHRDLEILRYTNSRYLAHKISSAESVKLIKNGKEKKTSLYASAAINNLCMTDESLSSFDTNLKVFPPIRSNEDRKALHKSILDNTIDIICSDHQPLEPERKDIEFQKASFGASTIETTFAMSQMYASEVLSPEVWVDKVVHGPQRIFQLPRHAIEVGNKVNLTYFDPTKEWLFDKSYSLSKNNFLLNKKLKGKVLATISKSKVHLFH